MIGLKARIQWIIDMMLKAICISSQEKEPWKTEHAWLLCGSYLRNEDFVTSEEVMFLCIKP